MSLGGLLFSEKRLADEGVDLRESGGVEERLESGVRGNYDQMQYIWEERKNDTKEISFKNVQWL